MIPSIRILDQTSANQIAAGEVVERPASIVKELVENSLDAGARRIDIAVEGSGVDFIRVQDDGWGIPAPQLPVAVLRHATSKISNIGDLDSLQTLGFRGEALPSIASVSRMEICSRSGEEISGTCLILQGGRQLEIKETGCPSGTSVTVRDLFFNTPARKKFLRSANTEFGLISDTVNRLALARPDVALTLKHPKQVVLQTPGRGDLLASIGAVFGHETARRLLPVQLTDGKWSLAGFISPPELIRPNRLNQLFAVNGRTIRSQFLSRAVEDGYHTLIPARMHPLLVLHLDLSPSEYDVNVHPTKMDIRFRDEKELAHFITAGIRETLLRARPLPDYVFVPNPIAKLPAVKQSPVKLPEAGFTHRIPPAVFNDIRIQSDSMQSPMARQPEPNSQDVNQEIWTEHKSGETWADNNEVRTPAPKEIDKLGIHKSNKMNATIELEDFRIEDKTGETYKTDYQDELCTEDKTEAKESTTLYAESDVNLPAIFNHEALSGESPTLFSDLNVWPVGQVFDSYLLATNGKELLIVDQHAAHERINYESLMAEAQTRPGLGQNLLIAVPVELTAQEEQAVLEHLWALHEMGFVLEQFGDRTYLLRAVPACAKEFDPEGLLRDFIGQILQAENVPSLTQLQEEWIYLLACKQSLKANHNLSLLEMEQLLSRLLQTANPYTCPHGRPIMVKLTKTEIEKRFYRS